ncbi:hypothetical protein QTA77_003602 [Salmonella enterica]|nr:hypothetical protein [Salmonella enterica]EBQ9804804.1 hypothetical protein [Salmonella enterica subsp. enterica serovar Rissen]EBS2245243.1 hypothetical protein [Salmonella enterica subsp. enterica serovar Rissen]EDQ3870809.1 hypothetical protein [Salmonella enterica subsp. enterica serovar Rissen]EDR3045887.1 hypothetical protein [Salmonella enterica subsp. enterica serovar Rissen]
MAPKTKEVATNLVDTGEPVEGVLVGCVVRATLDHEAGLVRELLAQRYREFGTELFEERGNELVDKVRRIFARLAAPLEESEETEGESVNTIDVTTLSDPDRVVVNAEEVK